MLGTKSNTLKNNFREECLFMLCKVIHKYNLEIEIQLQSIDLKIRLNLNTKR